MFRITRSTRWTRLYHPSFGDADHHTNLGAWGAWGAEFVCGAFCAPFYWSRKWSCAPIFYIWRLAIWDRFLRGARYRGSHSDGKIQRTFVLAACCPLFVIQMSEFDRVARPASENLDFGIASQSENIQMHLFTNVRR